MVSQNILSEAPKVFIYAFSSNFGPLKIIGTEYTAINVYMLVTCHPRFIVLNTKEIRNDF